MTTLSFIILTISLALFGQALFSLYLMLYSWEYPQRLRASRGPRKYLPPRFSFTVLLPARHEEEVIYDTIQRVWAANYPRDLLEIAIICHSDDQSTIVEAQRAIHDIGSPNIRVETFSNPPINKPHGLNVGLQHTSNQIVTVFDAEDDIDADIFAMINTIMLQENVGIVQAGVQLMNFRDHWFAPHNCMEYFFWFKSRLHFHANVGMIPLGGNSVFLRRELLERIRGWDDQCLTEDAEIGLRLSSLGERIRVVYETKRVTREETPNSTAAFVRQRTRWQQGYLQVLRKGIWLHLPRTSQKLLAFYTLSYPILQAILTLLWIPGLLAAFWVKFPVSVSLISFLPLYGLLFQLLATAFGAYMFTKEYGLKFPLLLPVEMAITFLPFQFVLGFSSVRVLYRELLGLRDWEKTQHIGAHRQTVIGTSAHQKQKEQVGEEELDNEATAPRPAIKKPALDEATAPRPAIKKPVATVDRSSELVGATSTSPRLPAIPKSNQTERETQSINTSASRSSEKHDTGEHRIWSAAPAS